MSWRSERGEGVSTYLWAAGVVAAMYFVAVWAPVYAESYQVKQILRGAANLSRQEPSDDKLRSQIILKCNGLGAHAEQESGEEVPDVAIAPEDITVERDNNEQTITISARYIRSVNYYFTGVRRQIEFSPSVVEDTKAVKW